MQSDIPDTSNRPGGCTAKTTKGVAHIAPGSTHTAGSTDIVAELLTTKQAAALAGVGERTWWRWSRSGWAPAPVKIGLGTRPAVRFRRDELQAWIESGCKPVDGRAGR